jgi:HEAT repeat protein
MTGPEVQVDPAVVEDLLQLLVKCLRAIRLYLPNNPMHAKAAENMQRGFQQIWQGLDRFTLKITDSGFEWEEQLIPEPDRNDSISWPLFKDGIRSLRFTPGAEDEEVVRFLNVLQQASLLPHDADDDILTLLWQEEFDHISYQVVEVGGEEGTPIEKSEEFGVARPADQMQQALRQDAVDEGPSGVIDPEEFESTLYFLDDQEIRYLKGEIDREYTQELRVNVLSMLLDVFELQMDMAFRTEIISIFEELLPHLLTAADFHAVAFFLSEMRVAIERAPGLIPEHRYALEEFPGKLSEPEVLSQILQSLDEAHVQPTEEELGQVFRELKPEAMNTVLAWLSRLTNQSARELLERAARDLAQRQPETIGKALTSRDNDVVLGALVLARELKLMSLNGQLSGLLGHEHVPVRVGVVDALAAMATANALQHVERAIDDSDRAVRIAAIKALTEKSHEPAAKRVETALFGRMLRSTDVSEKRAFFEAYGVLAGEDAIDNLKAVLLGGGMFSRKADANTRACAATALGKVASVRARSVLEKVAGDKEPLVRNAVANALQEAG